MTSKREKLQYAYVFFADLLTMAVSVLLAWLITDGLFGVLIPYTSTDWLQTLCLLFVAFVVTFFFFDQDKNIVTRSENEEISLSLRFNIAFGLVYAGCMLLAKATMLDSRYFAVTVPAVNAVLLPFSHAILKRLLIRFQRSWGMETLVGVVTTSDRAERLISEIRKDWSRRVVGVSLLEATPAAISTRVCGVEVKATFDDFMDWIRREALDEVYVDVPMDSGESFIPYLDEMESMGLTVHFRLPLLDRIEEACCDETSAARLSRSLGRCAGGNIVTMGTVELQLRDQIEFEKVRTAGEGQIAVEQMRQGLELQELTLAHRKREDEYSDERRARERELQRADRQSEMELDNAEMDAQIERLRKVKELNREDKKMDLDHEREMERLKQEALDKKARMTAEQLMAVAAGERTPNRCSRPPMPVSPIRSATKTVCWR